MTTLDDAEQQLDIALTRLESVAGRLADWRQTEAAAQSRVAAAESEAAQRIAQAEESLAAASAERDKANGEHQFLRDRCAALGHELAQCRSSADRVAAESAARIASLEARLADKTAEHERAAILLHETEEAATQEVARLDGECERLGALLAAARASADKLGQAARAAVDSLGAALRQDAGGG